MSENSKSAADGISVGDERRENLAAEIETVRRSGEPDAEQRADAMECILESLDELGRVEQEVAQGVREGWLDPDSELAMFAGANASAGVSDKPPRWRAVATGFDHEADHTLVVDLPASSKKPSEIEAAGPLLQEAQKRVQRVPTGTRGANTVERLLDYRFRIASIEKISDAT